MLAVGGAIRRHRPSQSGAQIIHIHQIFASFPRPTGTHFESGLRLETRFAPTYCAAFIV